MPRLFVVRVLNKKRVSASLQLFKWKIRAIAKLESKVVRTWFGQLFKVSNMNIRKRNLHSPGITNKTCG